MLAVIVVLLLTGIALILLEAIVPGGVLGIAGAVAVLASVFVCFREYGAAWGAAYFVFCAVLAGGVGGVTVLWVLKRFALKPVADTPPGDAVRNERPSLGARGRVTKVLNPTGRVEIAGRSWQVRAESSIRPVPKGETVEVVDYDSTYLVVRPEDEPETPTDSQSREQP